MWTEHLDHVRPEWLDGNGHMNLAYYVVVFDRGVDVWLEAAGLGAAYRASGFSVFAVETHTVYRQEVGGVAALRVLTRLVAAAGKRIHLMHIMMCGDAEIATHEVLFLHMDLAIRRASPMGPAAAARVQALAAPPEWPHPAWLGRHVGQRR